MSGNWTQVLCKRNMCFYLLGHLSIPQRLIFKMPYNTVSMQSLTLELTSNLQTPLISIPDMAFWVTGTCGEYSPLLYDLAFMSDSPLGFDGQFQLKSLGWFLLRSQHRFTSLHEHSFSQRLEVSLTYEECHQPYCTSLSRHTQGHFLHFLKSYFNFFIIVSSPLSFSPSKHFELK